MKQLKEYCSYESFLKNIRKNKFQTMIGEKMIGESSILSQVVSIENIFFVALRLKYGNDGDRMICTCYIG